MLAVLQVFLSGFLIDILYALWVLSVSDGKHWRAAIFSGVMALPSIFGIISIVDSHILAIPYAIGLALGSVAGMKINERLKAKLPSPEA